MTLKHLFFEVADLPDEAAQRARLLELGATPEQLAQVLDLCARERRRSGTRFSQPVAAAVARLDANELHSGDRLGPWLLAEPLGEGGMGRVFVVQRADGLYQQKAALKLLRGAAPPELLARERQILATLEHPHIARLLDGGSTPRGQPYFVMAFVEGQTLDAWAAAAPLAQRLAVIEQLAGALDFAHRHLIVHCDLKPANVLVNEAGHATLLDFGIARLEQDGDAGPHALTPHYAAPEQVGGEPLTSATDVFGLGKLAEALLDGAPRAREWRALVAKACHPDPAQRYPSALALVDDLRRWRAHRPLQALPATPGYRAAKALRRQWPAWLVGSAAVMMGAGFTWQLAHSRDRARLEAQTSQQTADFVVGLFQGANPMEGGRPDLPVSELLDRGRERLTRELADQPELRGRLQGVLAKVYRNIGKPKDALPLAEAAASAPYADPLDRANALAELARTQARSSGVERAIATAEQALRLREQHGQGQPNLVGESHHQLLVLKSDARRFEEAEQHGQRALESLNRHAPDDLEQQATLQANLGRLYLFAGLPAQAEAPMRRALQMREQLHGEGHAQTLHTATNLAAVLHDLLRLDESEAMLRRLIEQRRALHGPDSDLVMQVQRELAYVLLDADRPQEGQALMQEVLATALRANGAQSGQMANALRSLAELQAASGDVAAAEASFADAAQRGDGKALAGRNQVRLRRAWAQLLLDAERLAEADAVLAPALAYVREKAKPGEGDRIETEALAAELSLRRGDPMPARTLLAALAAEPAATGAAARPARVEALLLRLRALASSDAEAAPLHAQAWLLAARTLGPGDPRLAPIRLSQAESLLRAGKPAEAAPLLATLRQHAARLPARHPLRRRIEAL